MSHAEVMHADGYWRQYEVKIAWEQAYPDPRGEVKGTIEALRETRPKPNDPWTPRLAIRREDGVLVVVDAYQQRLLAELVLTKPIVGEKICIRYLGEDAKAAPGMNPVKRFKVWVDRGGSTPPAPEPRTPDPGPSETLTGSAPRENPP